MFQGRLGVSLCTSPLPRSRGGLDDLHLRIGDQISDGSTPELNTENLKRCFRSHPMLMKTARVVCLHLNEIVCVWWRYSPSAVQDRPAFGVKHWPALRAYPPHTNNLGQVLADYHSSYYLQRL
jgi:hypothetical protein